MPLKFERGIPMVAASFTDTPLNMDILRDQSLDIAELRVDLFKDQSAPAIYEVLRRFQRADIRTMLTARTYAQGGRWTGSHTEWIDLLMQVHDAVDIIDIEDDCEVPDELRGILGMSLEGGPLLLISHHNKTGTPSDLNAIRTRALEKNPDLIKIATYIRPSYAAADLKNLTTFAIEHGGKQNMIVIGMGPAGVISRFSLVLFGSVIVFCSREFLTAPGQLSLDDTVNLLRILYPRYDASIAIRLESMRFC